ncbi:MAG TPA: aspartyl protease family protein [Candidatus Gastranaerophilales bacterium]|nr:aspartyl protease family protein [Candidatus Gastranaerophilales bacterium]
MRKILISTLTFVTLLLFNSAVNADDLQQGLAYYKAGEYKEAQLVFKKIVLNEPDNYSARYMLAVSLVQNQKYDEAKEFYRSVISNSTNQHLVTLSETGLQNLGESPDYYIDKNVTKAVINVNTAGTVMVIEDVTLNDKLNTKFVFDTGATYTTISRTAASKLNISEQGAKRLKIMTGSGFINAPLVKVDKIEIKGIVARNVEVIIVDLPNSNDGNGISGLLGLSFLEKFKITLDKSKGQITLEKN